ncbi:MAG: FAD-dependent oxidoreductase [Calothrix sp. MO_167.B12]|nr:FAD-dependent oxidoreductase [Calothrix sp. MO_167.B12]
MFVENKNLTFLERQPDTGELFLCTYKSLEQGADLLSPPIIISNENTSEEGGKVLILGAGVAGLTAAYDLLKQNRNRPEDKQFQVFLLEATGHVGGRSLTLRPGDSFTEEIPLSTGTVTVTQTLSFDREPGEPYEPYLNAGPGRIPSNHIHVLSLCQELGVDLEVYIMETRSNLVVTKGGLPGNKGVNRQIVNDIRGHIANELYHHLKDKKFDQGTPEAETQKNLLNLLIYFGTLTKKDNDYSYSGSQRAGYSKLPGLTYGTELEPIKLEHLVDAQLWKRSLYQAEDFLWQTTSFQPVGGMDKIEKALEEKIRELGGTILLNCPVTSIRKRSSGGWTVFYNDRQQGGDRSAEIQGDFCLVNIPLPLLGDLVQPGDFDSDYWEALNKVMSTEGFFRPTCKVGWQAERKLWQQPTDENNVPIYGGISRIDHPMTQMWYPSDSFYAKLGALTGAYNYEHEAERWGQMLPKERIEEAREGAKLLHGEEFGNQLKHGISIAWQNIPTQKGGWSDWKRVAQTPEEQAQIMNKVRLGNQNFHVIGDQVSFLPGWKEGAVLSAQEVFAKVTKVKNYLLTQVKRVPDTRALIEGYQYCPEE